MKFEEYASRILKATDESYVGLELDLRFDVIIFLKKKLSEKQMNQAQLAEKLKMKPSQLNRILRAESNLTLETIARIYHAFGCRPTIIERYVFSQVVGGDIHPVRKGSAYMMEAISIASSGR